jgi:hypothetical protein
MKNRSGTYGKIRETLLLEKLCRNPVHGSRASPRTDYGMLKINHLAVRPEHVEGRMANYDTVSEGGGKRVGVKKLSGIAKTLRKEATHPSP